MSRNAFTLLRFGESVDDSAPKWGGVRLNSEIGGGGVDDWPWKWGGGCDRGHQKMGGGGCICAAEGRANLGTPPLKVVLASSLTGEFVILLNVGKAPCLI